MKPIIFLFVVPIKIYQLFISPLLSSNCRFYPTCSQYCIDSLNKFGFFKGMYYSFIRLKECHPFGKSGYDPVKAKVYFKEISLKEIKHHRKKNLYQYYPKELSVYKEDNYKTTRHFGLFNDEDLVSGLTLIQKTIMKKKYKSFQIRGMFTVKGKVRKGYGSILINCLSQELKKTGIEIIWCNSRVSAIKFYKKNKFQEIGKVFNIQYIGRHKKLLRYL